MTVDYGESRSLARTRVWRWMTDSGGHGIRHLPAGTVVEYWDTIPNRVEAPKPVRLLDGTVGWFTLYFLEPLSPLEQLAHCAE